MEVFQLHGDWIGSRWTRAFPVILITLLFATTTSVAHANESFQIEQAEFELVWERTEAPVADGITERSWLWGPEPRTPGLQERYLDSPGEQRTVQYFDKGRMEVNDPAADPADPWFVTSGLLTRELISGEIQIGDTAFLDTGEGASIHVAGDHLNPFPQYRHLSEIVDQGNPDRTGERADKVFTPEGIDPGIIPPDDPNAEFVHHVVYHGPDGVDVGYNIPAAFWDYLNAPGTVYDGEGNPVTAEPLFSWVFVMGFPIADAFWSEVPVGGELQWVLIQPFERRVLTYTSGNRPEWQVEMGNIGQHYRDWRGQYFPEARTGGDPEFFGLSAGETWRFGSAFGFDEIWETTGTSTNFIPGSVLYTRDEHKIDGLRTTYWSSAVDGLYLHGWDRRDEHRNLVDMTVYSPALHVMPAEWDGSLVLSTQATAISMNAEPSRQTIEFHMAVSGQIVSTQAGQFQTWRIESNDFGDPRLAHRLGAVLWFEGGIGVVQWRENESSAWLIESSVLNQ